MADIKSYIKEKEKREKQQADYKKKIRKHKLTSVYRILLAVFGIAALAVLAAAQYKRHVYTSYDILSSVPRQNILGSIDVRLGNAVLTYSKDGVHCTDLKGEVVWNQTYQMQEPLVAVCGDTVAIGDYNGRSIYVQNAQKQLGTISTTMPIREVTVSQSGMVTAVLADTDKAWVNTYNAEGELLYYGEAHMDGAGYPCAISLSPGGELLGISYLYVDAGTLKTNIAFYNFQDVGESQTDKIVSTWSYSDLLAPMLRFMNDSAAFAVGDNRLMIYSGGRKPVSGLEHIYDEEVLSVFYNQSYVGLVFRSEQSDSLYRLDVYSAAAKEVGRFYFDIEYTDLFFDQDQFVAYNDTECVIMTLDGVEKFNGTFSKPVRLMLPGSGAYRYVLVTASSIDTIQMK